MKLRTCKFLKWLLFAVTLFVALSAIAVHIAASDGCILYRERENEGALEVSYLYLNDSRTYTIEIDEPKLCNLTFSTNDGSVYLQVLDSTGDYKVATVFSGFFLSWEFMAESDITIHVKAIEHRGGFTFSSTEPKKRS